MTEQRATPRASAALLRGPGEEFSAGRYAEPAHREIDSLLADRRRPIVVGGTGLVPAGGAGGPGPAAAGPRRIREEVERELAERGSEALHAELDRRAGREGRPERPQADRTLDRAVAGGDRASSGAEGLWTAELRHPTLLVGLTMDRERLAERIGARVDEMVAAGAADEARAAREAGASRTARAALGFEQLGHDAAPRPSDRVDQGGAPPYARRQLTWMRRMEGVSVIDRTAARMKRPTVRRAPR